MWQVIHHVVFMRHTAIQFFQAAQFVHPQSGEAIELHGADITARAFDPQHLDRFAGQGIQLPYLGAGVAAAVVGDSEIGPQ
jgi:hypothetical protein